MFKMPMGNLDTNFSAPFMSLDSEQLFKRNLNGLSKWPKNIIGEWGYEKKSIDYTYNNLGMRESILIDDNFDFSKYTVFIGCSHVEGIGVSKDSTIPALFEKITDIPALNFGKHAASNEQIYHNLCWLLGQKTKPKQIIILWTYPDRHLFYIPRLDNDVESLELLQVTPPMLEKEYYRRQLQPYVGEKYFDPYACYRTVMYYQLVDNLKACNNIRDFGFFNHKTYKKLFPKEYNRKFKKDIAFNDKLNRIMWNELTAAVANANGEVGNVYYKYWGRDLVFNFMENPQTEDDFAPSSAHWGYETNLSFAKYIAAAL